MDIDAKLLWLYAVGMFLSFLFYVEELITDNATVERVGIAKAIILVITNALIGGVVMVTVYYGLIQFKPEWHDYLKVGIAGTTAMLGKDMVRLYHKFIKARAGK